ncbi:MAG TPA: rRNA pseudouridine synthase [Thermopetrobacter sp.]|nr:rRNA pseudouridine synthase [Thermopetrobacter sp.]
MTDKGQRLARRIARAGVCSRRAAEELIREGRVMVNGETVTTPAVNVTADDVVVVDGAPLPSPAPVRLWRYHKPCGLIVSERDEKGRPTVFERLPGDLGRVISVGRLDLNSEGLLLLTNDGALARRLELPATGWTRRYRVRAFGCVTQDALAALRDGLTIDGVHYGKIVAKLDTAEGANVWMTFALKEGKNREIRRICEHLGLKVNRLIRTAYGPFQLGRLKRGALAEVSPRQLREQLGAIWRDIGGGRG